MEFPTASGAVNAAEDLIAAADPPIRIGVHLGEVHVTPTGDLLGHGVNVAARLQALASPGSVLVSDDVRRAVRSTFASRLTTHGAVRLEKMGGTVNLVARGSVSAADRGRMAWRRFRTFRCGPPPCSHFCHGEAHGFGGLTSRDVGRGPGPSGHPPV